MRPRRAAKMVATRHRCAGDAVAVRRRQWWPSAWPHVSAGVCSLSSCEAPRFSPHHRSSYIAQHCPRDHYMHRALVSTVTSTRSITARICSQAKSTPPPHAHHARRFASCTQAHNAVSLRSLAASAHSQPLRAFAAIGPRFTLGPRHTASLRSPFPCPAVAATVWRTLKSGSERCRLDRKRARRCTSCTCTAAQEACKALVECSAERHKWLPSQRAAHESGSRTGPLP